MAGCVFVLWLIHPPLLSWGLRFALVRAASEAGLQLEIGNIQANVARPMSSQQDFTLVSARSGFKCARDLVQ